MKVTQIIAGVAAGAVGAAAWAAIGFYFGVNLGLVAWGIGLLVGVAIAMTGASGRLPGVAAVLISIVAVLAGKYGTFELAAERVHRVNQADIAQLDVGDRGVLATRLRQLAEQRMEAGEELAWPDGMSLDDANDLADYPPDLREEVEKEWSAKTESEREELRERHREDVEETMAIMRGGFRGIQRAAFFSSFGFRDMLYLGAAVFTAWWIAGRRDDDSEVD